MLLVLFLAALILLGASTWIIVLFSRQNQALSAFGAQENGPLYCGNRLSRSACIESRSDHHAPGRHNLSPLALCAILDATGRSPDEYGLLPCD